MVIILDSLLNAQIYVKTNYRFALPPKRNYSDNSDFELTKFEKENIKRKKVTKSNYQHISETINSQFLLDAVNDSKKLNNKTFQPKSSSRKLDASSKTNQPIDKVDSEINISKSIFDTDFVISPLKTPVISTKSKCETATSSNTETNIQKNRIEIVSVENVEKFDLANCTITPVDLEFSIGDDINNGTIWYFINYLLYY